MTWLVPLRFAGSSYALACSTSICWTQLGLGLFHFDLLDLVRPWLVPLRFGLSHSNSPWTFDPLGFWLVVPLSQPKDLVLLDFGYLSQLASPRT